MSWGTIIESMTEAVRLILSLDPTVISITIRSIETARTRLQGENK